MDRFENEIKLLVDDERAFVTLGGLLLGRGVALPMPATQINRFFDTDDRVLGRGGFVLRLREEGERLTLTAKGPARAGASTNGLVSKAEEEIEITAAEGAAIRAGATSPLDLLEARLASRPALLGAMRGAAGERPLAEVGAFRNERRSVGPLDVATAAGTVKIVLELDRTEFPGDRVDHEVEAEILEGDPVAVLARFRDLFREAGLAWRPAPSKPKRFFEALDAHAG